MNEEIVIDGVTYIKKQSGAREMIKRYIRENPLRGTYILLDESHIKLLQYLPSANNRCWTYEVCDWVKVFCKEFDGSYPMHEHDDCMGYQYISIDKVK